MDTVARIFFRESEKKVNIARGTRISNLVCTLVAIYRFEHESTKKALRDYPNKDDCLYEFIRRLRASIDMESAPAFDIRYTFDIFIRDNKTIVDSLFSKVNTGIKVVNSFNTEDKGLLLVHLVNEKEKEELERRMKEQAITGLDLYHDVDQYMNIRHSKRSLCLNSDGYVYYRDKKMGKIFSAVCVRDAKQDRYFALMNINTAWVIYDNFVESTVQTCMRSLCVNKFLEDAVMCIFEREQ